MKRVRFNWLQSPTVVVIGMITGILVGIYAENVAGVVADFGDLFLSFLRMCAIPVMVGALVTSLCALVRRDDAEMPVVRFAALMVLGMLAVAAIGAAVAGIGRPGAGIDLSERRVFGQALVEHVFADVEQVSAGESGGRASGRLFYGLLPANPFIAFVEGNTVQVLFLTVLFGIMLGLIPRSMADPVVQLAEATFNVFQTAISMSLYLLPFGLMGIMANVVLTTGADLLEATVRLIVYTHVACVAVMALTAVGVAYLGRIPIREQLAGLKKPLVVAFGTRDSIATMPTVMSALTEKFGIKPELVKFAVPTGILLCRNSIIILYVVSLIFAAQLYAIPLSALDVFVIIVGSAVAQLATVGTPVLVALGAASIVAEPVGLPFNAVHLIMTGILPVLDPIITTMNVHVISSLTILVTRRRERAAAKQGRRAPAAVAAGCLALLALSPVIVSASPVAFAAAAEDQAATPGEARYVRSLPPDIARIVERGELVVAMLAEEQYPFFYRDEHGEWRGVDIDMAKDIAREFGVALRIDRVAQTYDAVVDRVDQGYADIAISNLSTTLQRSKSVLFTETYIPLRQGLVVNRVQLAATGRERDDPARVINDAGGKVGVLADSSYVEFAARRFPNAEIVKYPNVPELFEAARRGEVMGSLYDEHHIKQYALENPSWLVDVDIRLYEDDKDMIAMAVSWRDPYLHQWLNTYLRVREIRWTIDELLKAYPPPWKGR